MFIPFWVLVIGAVVLYYWYKSIKEVKKDSVEYFEKMAEYFKESIFKLEHFDSPRFVDIQDAYDAMEINYLRLKQRNLSNPEKALELSRDWERYAESLSELKSAGVYLDVDMGDNAYDNFQESAKEPSIIKEEVEKKFKSLLGKDFHKIPPNYDDRRKKAGKEDGLFNLKEDWKLFYPDSDNFRRMIDLREKSGKEYEEEKKKSKN